MATSLYLCLFASTIVSTSGSLKPNNDILSSSNLAAGPEEEWLPGSNPWVFDSASNPILEPPGLLEWILVDPAVIQLGDQIHMFANEVFHGILHFTAPLNSPTNFTKLNTVIAFPGCVRPSILLVGSTLHLYYEQYQLPLFRSSAIMLRTARLIMEGETLVLGWEADSVQILRPELAWEKEEGSRVGNPYVFHAAGDLNRGDEDGNAKREDEEFWMYYSAGSTHLADSNIDEPLHLGLAKAPTPAGPWFRVSELPIAIEGEGLPGQSVIGVGSLKILSGKNSQIFALSNRITRNVETNSTGSTISLLSSIDGLAWQVVIGDLIGPETEVENSWKRAYVYGFDKIQDPTSDQHWLVFYNGRDGWLVGREAIGVSLWPESTFLDDEMRFV